MPCPSTTLTIGDVVVQQDAHGRYSLNGLHRAAGGESRHQPSNFLRNDSTRGLVAELTRSSDSMNGPVETIRRGAAQGTFVMKALVYDYAMWISAAFRLRAIDAFAAMARGEPRVSANMSPRQRGRGDDLREVSRCKWGKDSKGAARTIHSVTGANAPTPASPALNSCSQCSALRLRATGAQRRTDATAVRFPGTWNCGTWALQSAGSERRARILGARSSP